MSANALVRSMLILRCDKKSVLVRFGCYTVNVFLFRSGRQHEDPKLRPVFDSPRLHLEPTCAPKFREHRVARPMDERRLLRGSNLPRFVLDRRERHLPLFRRGSPNNP